MDTRDAVAAHRLARPALDGFRGSHQSMTINLHAVTDFEKGDVGRVHGHKVSRVDQPALTDGLVIALQSVKAGSNGWFERK